MGFFKETDSPNDFGLRREGGWIGAVFVLIMVLFSAAILLSEPNITPRMFASLRIAAYQNGQESLTSSHYQALHPFFITLLHHLLSLRIPHYPCTHMLPTLVGERQAFFLSAARDGEEIICRERVDNQRKAERRRGERSI